MKNQKLFYILLVGTVATVFSLRSESYKDLSREDRELLAKAKTAEIVLPEPTETAKDFGLGDQKEKGKKAQKVEKKSEAELKSKFSFVIEKTNDPEAAEQKGLEKMTRALFVFFQGNQSPSQLVEKLGAAGLEPVVAKDFNEDTGKMLVIRTNETIPGTRYLHAQYFEGEDKQPFIQHMSFEFRPGPRAMENAVEAVTAQIPGLGQPVEKRDDFVLWKDGKDNICWVKKLSNEELEEDPFNAHDVATDAGTIKLACEQDIHAHDDETHGK